MNINQSKGITLVSLMITVVILSMLAGISMDIGSDLINKTKLENLKTNMMLIQAKTKEYVEEASFKSGKENTITDEVKAELIGRPLTDDEISTLSNILEQYPIENELYYKLEQAHLEELGLDKIETTSQNFYIVVYDIKNIKVDVINTKGHKAEDGNIYYTLSQLNNIEE